MALQLDRVSGIRGLFQRLSEATRWELTVWTSLFVLIFHGYDVWYYDAAIALLTLAAFLHRPLLDRPLFWLTISAVIAFRLWNFWYPIDNHKILLLYWCLALALAACFQRREGKETTIAESARLLLVLVMGLAVVQKVLAPDYLSSSFFEAILLTDGRFSLFMQFFGADPAALADNRALIDELKTAHLEDGPDSVQLYRSAATGWVAAFLTWWTILIEAAIAVAFLPRRPWADAIGHALLIVFIVCVYWVAPVAGFGITLAILAIAMTSEHWVRLRFGYIGTIVLVEVYATPWQNYLPL